MVDRQFVNVIVLGFAFMFIFTAFQTGSMIEPVVLKSIGKIDPGYKGNGYISLAVIYAVLAACNWLAPSVISYTGPKLAMIIGGITYAVFISNFLYPVEWVLYFVSVLIGIGAALIWTGQGNCLTINSDSETMSRNSGIFWAMLQCSLLFGNMFVYFAFQGEKIIGKSTINMVFGVLLGVCCLGVMLLLLLRSSSQEILSIRESDEPKGATVELVKAFKLFQTTDMILLSFTFFYTGLELSFFSGVYGTCISNTKHFGADAAKYVGISGILIGAGEITGGATFGILGKKTNKYGRDPIVLLGYIFHMITFYLIFLNLPAASPISGEAHEPAYIKSNIYLAIVCSFALGFGDACFNTQVYSILGSLYPDDSAPAFALFKFVQSVAAAGAFFYSTVAKLPIQLLIMVIFGTIGSFSFFLVEWKASSASSLITSDKRTTSIN